MFAFIFVITSIISGGYSFDDHWWATMSLYPGVILFSTMAIDFKKILLCSLPDIYFNSIFYLKCFIYNKHERKHICYA